MPVFNTEKPVGMMRDGDSYNYLTNKGIEKPVFNELIFNDGVNSDFERPSAGVAEPLNFTILPSGLVYVSGAFKTKSTTTGNDKTVGVIPLKYRPRRFMTFPAISFLNGVITTWYMVYLGDGILNAFVAGANPAPPPVSENVFLEGMNYIPVKL
jgi:hypothetical protein